MSVEYVYHNYAEPVPSVKGFRSKMRRRFESIYVPSAFDEQDGNNSRTYKSSGLHTVSVLTVFGIVALHILGFILMYFTSNSLPSLVMLKEKQSPTTSKFIGERALYDLKELTSYGPRVVGSFENEVTTVKLLKIKLDAIISGANQHQFIEYFHHVSNRSGFVLRSSLGALIAAYDNLQNIIVVVHSKNETARSLLINAHFDSVPTSPGGSDNGINCAASLEVVRYLAAQAEPPVHNIVFLFNGAEETGLQASHAFITQHPWAKRCDVVINLDAAGAAGKIALFQTGPNAPWLIDYYAKVPYPFGNVAGEEIFQSDLIPSDTDFRNFRDAGGMIGLDMAFIKDGYRYHTKFDGVENIPLGSLQHVGDNLLTLVALLGNAPELGDKTLPTGKTTYLDFFGLFMIFYRSHVAMFLNWITIFVSVGVFLFYTYDVNIGINSSSLKVLLFSMISVLSGWIIAAICIIAIAFLMDTFQYSLSWYRYYWITIGLYTAPTILCISYPLLLFKSNKISDNTKAQLQTHSVRLLWTVIILIGIVFNIRTVYAVVILVLCNSMAFGLIYLLRLQYTRFWVMICAVLNLLPAVFFMYLANTLFSLTVPITGRMGSSINPEFIIGILTMVFTIAICSPLVPIVTITSKPKFLYIFFAAMLVITLCVVSFRPDALFPYSGDKQWPTPQRFWILHTRRSFSEDNTNNIHEDAGYYMVNMDRNSPRSVSTFVPELLRQASNVQENCTKYPLCGFPLAHPKMTRFVPYSTWIPTGEKPEVNQLTTLNVLAKQQLNNTTVQYKVEITGADRLTIVLSANKPTVKLSGIDLISSGNDDVPVLNEHHSTYLINYVSAKQSVLQFSFNVETLTIINDQHTNNTSSAAIQFAVCGIYVHDEKKYPKTHMYQKFLQEFPNWTDLTAWVATYQTGFI